MVGEPGVHRVAQVTSRAPHFDKPDYIVYDLDPPEDFKFSEVAAIALEFKEHLEGLGYHPFVKTTGRKGLHVLTPIEPKWDFRKHLRRPRLLPTRSWRRTGRSSH